ncbi:hypothetical protein [Microlunatus phosphovorus]|nr:hypothetical protein [Microlunatus phosphovorus]
MPDRSKPPSTPSKTWSTSKGRPPTIEAFPNNEVLLVGDQPRPLADQACAALLELLGRASTTTLHEQDALGERFRELGPRVSTSVRALAEALIRAHVDMDMEWMEPERPTVRASLPVSAAGWIREFVTGRELDEEELTLVGVVRTVSDIAKWSVETAERLEQVDASRLPVEVVHSTKVGDEIRLLVLARLTERPDGTVRREMSARQLLADDGRE